MKKIFLLFILILTLSSFGCGRAKEGELVFAAMKGPTAIGALEMINAEDKICTFAEISATADEAIAKLTSGAATIAALPANFAAMMHNKTNSKDKLQVLAINTLNVLSIIQKGEIVSTLDELVGKTILVPGKGTTPDYTLQYILKSNDLEWVEAISNAAEDKVNLVYVNEAAEIPGKLTQGYSLAITPEPVATSVLLNPSLNASVAFSIADLWRDITGKDDIVTGVIVAKKSFVDKNKLKIDGFLARYMTSIEYAQMEENAGQIADWMVGAGIITNKTVAQNCLQRCDIAYVDKAEMKEKLDVYYNVLFEMNSNTVGGKIPDESFYYF